VRESSLLLAILVSHSHSSKASGLVMMLNMRMSSLSKESSLDGMHSSGLARVVDSVAVLSISLSVVIASIRANSSGLVVSLSVVVLLQARVSLLSEESSLNGMHSLVEGRMRLSVAVMSISLVVSIRSVGVARMV